MANIKTWRDLVVWGSAHELAICTYRLTANFPSEEKFGLVAQMRRAAVSVASNIVEGFHRRTLKDSLSFYNVADASLEELRYQYVLARDLQYVALSDFTPAPGGHGREAVGAWPPVRGFSAPAPRWGRGHGRESVERFTQGCDLMDKTGRLIGAWMKSQRDNVGIKH